ncbi:MAG: spheroidene monooxygenase [Actinobacteria bacterium]|nr:spheroidene monooxygenase [Actinomycetota bacterium]
MIAVIYFWKIRRRDVPFAIVRMALDRFALNRNRHIDFYKLIGCGRGENFLPGDADPLRWGLIVCIENEGLEQLDQSRTIARWRKRSLREFRAILNPVSSHGEWSGARPFDFRNAAQTQVSNSLGMAAITRAKIAWRHYPRFLRAIPPVNLEVQSAPGRIASFGIGEAPIGLQGTFSLWRSAADLRNFAYKGPAHAEAIAATEKFKWYSEELFARFEVQEIRGGL